MQTGENMKTRRPSDVLGFAIFLSVLFVGIAYVIYQNLLYARVDDPFFVGILIANTYAIYRFADHLKKRLERNWPANEKALYRAGKRRTKEEMISDVFNRRRSLILGVPFGGFFFVAVLYLKPWCNEPLSCVDSHANELLALFLFLVNIIAGMALYSLYVYFRYTLKAGYRIKVDLWDRSANAVEALANTSQRVVLATAFVAFAGMLSLIDSKFNPDYPIVVFSIFSVSIILLSYIVPLIPITNRLRKKKRRNLNKINKLIQQEYNALIDPGGDPRSNLDTKRFDALVSVRQSVKKIRAFPPVGEESISTAIQVTVLTMLPSLIDMVLPAIKGLFEKL